ncbi:hypothetical protein ACLBWJ_08900 [Microbacterium sp. M4A5_1d]
MKTRLLTRAALSAAVLTILATAAVTPAWASGTAAQPCSIDEKQAGDCAPYLASADEDPVEAAVRQLVAQGESAGATAFVEKKSANLDSASAADLRAVLAEATASESTDVSRGGVQADALRAPAIRDGRVIGKIWYLDEKLDYGYCRPDGTGCGPVVGTVQLKFSYNINEYPTVTLDGEVRAIAGSLIEVNPLECKTYYELPLFDQVLHDWNNCDSAQFRGMGTGPLIFEENYQHGSAPGTKYHVELSGKITTYHDPGQPLWFLRNSHTYTVVHTGTSGATF